MEIFRTLGALIEPPAAEHRRLAGLLDLSEPPAPSVYSDLFLFQLYPYASVYLGSEGMLGGEARDRIAGFWRALDETPPAECDHLSVMLALYARLADLESGSSEDERRAFWAHARRTFFWEHLVSWLPVFLDKLGAMADSYYGRWTEVLQRALGEEARALEPAETLSLHLRTAEPLSDPRESGGEELIDGLLAPVRSGMILTRSDLERAARDLDVGGRAGERKFVLRALFAQDPAGTLGWLGEEGSRWKDLHSQRADPWGQASTFWKERAARTGELLEELGRESSRP